MSSLQDDILYCINKNEEKRAKIKDLINCVSSNKKINKYNMAEEIYKLLYNKKIKFVNNSKGNFIIDFFSIKNSWYLFSIFVITLSLVSSIFISNNYILIKGIMVSPLLFFYPGYGIVESIYPKREEWNELERAALSIGMSLAVLPLIGLILNQLPMGLNVDTVSVSIYIFSIIMIIIARYRKYQYEKLMGV